SALHADFTDALDLSPEAKDVDEFRQLFCDIYGVDDLGEGFGGIMRNAHLVRRAREIVASNLVVSVDEKRTFLCLALLDLSGADDSKPIGLSLAGESAGNGHRIALFVLSEMMAYYGNLVGNFRCLVVISVEDREGATLIATYRDELVAVRCHKKCPERSRRDEVFDWNNPYFEKQLRVSCLTSVSRSVWLERWNGALSTRPVDGWSRRLEGAGRVDVWFRTLSMMIQSALIPPPALFASSQPKKGFNFAGSSPDLPKKEATVVKTIEPQGQAAVHLPRPKKGDAVILVMRFSGTCFTFGAENDKNGRDGVLLTTYTLPHLGTAGSV
ncbi:hypothetical protein BDK51DRAFT_26016, partial [Blyttiomyces helicus]